MRTLGYLGPPGTFSHTAALLYAESYRCLPVCCTGIEGVFKDVCSGRLDYGIVPVENSLGGSVGETMDLLSAAEKVYIISELMLPVRQHLLVRPGVALQQVQKVYSHPQALAQGRRYLSQHLAGVPVVATASTGAAALAVAESPAPLAAIGSESAAANYGLEMIASDIQGDAGNLTRFLVLGRENASVAGPAKTSLALAVKDSPGALYRILKEFALREINLTRIESRPAGGRLGEYIFFIDLSGRADDSEVSGAVREIGHQALWVKMLGCYQSFNENELRVTRASGETDGLAGLRKKIDLVDNEIMYLLTMRQRLVEQVSTYKTDRSVVDSRRETEIISRLKTAARQNNLDPCTVEKIYQLILKGSVRRQRELLACK